MKLKSCLTSCLTRVIVVLFLVVMVSITLSPYAVAHFDGLEKWGVKAYRWKVEAGEYLRARWGRGWWSRSW